MTRPTRCGRCGASLAAARAHDEALDVDGHVVVGFLECPTCVAAYCYQRAVSVETVAAGSRPAGAAFSDRPVQLRLDL